MISDRIKSSIGKATGYKDVSLEVPEVESYGDYSSNVAMVMFSKAGSKNLPAQAGSKAKSTDQKLKVGDFKDPKELAESIVGKLYKDDGLKNIVSRIEIADPGFINFWISEKALKKELGKILKSGEKYGSSDVLSGEKIMLEFGQPNTHKLPHIGHLFSFVFGESLVRLLGSQGADVFRANYQGDIGPHVAKCLWAYKKEDPQIPATVEGKAKLLQEMYQYGSNEYEENGSAKEEIDIMNKAIYEKNEALYELWERTRKWSIDYYKKFEERLGVMYRRYFYESEVFEEGRKIVEENLDKVFKESEGAIIFEGSKYGLHDRVFITKNKTPTYEAKDMYLQKLKMQEWPYDLMIVTTANEQSSYFDVVFKALELLDPDYKDKLKHIGYGMVNLKGGKMSSRKGEIIGGAELLDMTVYEVRKIMEDGDYSDKEAEKIAETVGVGAVKYAFLKTNPLKDISFDVKESISLDGNSGPYLQYTVARANSVLHRAKFSVSNLPVRQAGFQFPKNIKPEKEELALLRAFIQFEGVIGNAAVNYSPNLLCNYLYDLAQKFNSFYNSCRIIRDRGQETGDNEVQDFRLALTSATGTILENGLNLLGIDTPKKM